MTDSVMDLAVIGAGPTGLSAGVAAKQAGLACVLFDSGCLARSITLYPINATFFSTSERLEIGGVPFITPGDKPTRADALKYYRRVASAFDLDIRQYEEVVRVAGRQGGFALETVTKDGVRRSHRAANLVIATGYAGHPNTMGIPGEDLPSVRHYFTEAHPYHDQDVVVVGAGNSAVEAALECYRAGARVTLVHFLDRLDSGVKPWIRPDIENRLAGGEIHVRWNTRVVEVAPGCVRLRDERTGQETALANDFVLAMTGYRPDPRLLLELGVSIDPVTGEPAYDPDTMETDVSGVFLAGVIAGGNRPDRIFIEDGRHHGPLAVRAILARTGRRPAGEIALGVPPGERPVDVEADGIRSTEERNPSAR